MSGVRIVKGKYPHVGWVDLEGKGILTEVAIMKNSMQGLMFIRLNALDAIDRQRLFRIITNRNAHLYELWDLMSNMTLGNGANALEYFHQSVKVLTPQGQVMNPTMGRVAAPSVTGVVQPPAPTEPPMQDITPAQAPITESAPKKRTTTRKKTTTEAPAAE